MRIQGGQPEEEGFVLGAVLQSGHPGFTSARRFCHHLARLGIGPGGENKSGGGSFEDIVEAILDRITKMPFPRCCGVVSRILQQLDKGDGFLGQRPVQLLGSGVVGVAPRNDTCPAWTARIGSQVSMLELHPALRQGIDVGRLDRGVTIDPAIVPVHVIGNDENEVWFLSGE